jgi:glycosyltransferase involved in cell wall biosynthesis
VISRTAALSEVAADAALSLDPHDPEELAQAMGRMLTEPELRQRLRSSGPSQASSFNWERSE